MFRVDVRRTSLPALERKFIFQFASFRLTLSTTNCTSFRVGLLWDRGSLRCDPKSFEAWMFRVSSNSSRISRLVLGEKINLLLSSFTFLPDTFPNLTRISRIAKAPIIHSSKQKKVIRKEQVRYFNFFPSNPKGHPFLHLAGVIYE